MYTINNNCAIKNKWIYCCWSINVHRLCYYWVVWFTYRKVTIICFLGTVWPFVKIQNMFYCTSGENTPPWCSSRQRQPRIASCRGNTTTKKVKMNVRKVLLHRKLYCNVHHLKKRLGITIRNSTHLCMVGVAAFLQWFLLNLSAFILRSSQIA